MTALPHAPSIYAATATGLKDWPHLEGDHQADIVIIGAGYTGLSTALHLAQSGRSVVVLEANTVGWGASGRNGGQLHSGQRQDVATMERWYGRDQAHALFDLAEEAKRLVKELIAAHAIDCQWQSGLIHAVHKPRYVAHLQPDIDKLANDYGVSDITLLDRDQLHAAIGAEGYHGGTRDASAGHLQPLSYALGLARAAEAAGARIFEGSRVVTLGANRVETATGSVTAAEIVVACNGYLDGLEPETDQRIMPLNNFILATEPLGARADALIPAREAVSDSRFVIYYWRIDAQGRLIFGGGENYSPHFPKDIKAFVRAHMLKAYPGLADVRIDHAWGGTLALTVNRMPFIRRLRPGLYSAAGYSGHGIAIATLAGKLMAEAIRGDTDRFDVMAAIPAMRFPGGRLLRHPSMVLAMTWYALMDRL